MKRILQLSGMMIVALVLLFSARSTQASHYQGSDLTYGFAGPNTYNVVFKVYRDCSGIDLDPDYDLTIRCMNGGSSRIVVMTPTGTPVIGNPYCQSSGKNGICLGTSGGTGQPDNFQTRTYSALVVFTAAERACGMVRLSTVNNARPSTANLQGAANLYSEATINLAAGINNNSTQFFAQNIPIPFFCAEDEVRYSLNAVDLDTVRGGDSLSYVLRQPWSEANTPVGYTTFTASSIKNPNPPGQVIPTPAGTYANNFPMVSYTADWTLPNPVPQKLFKLDNRNGSMHFFTPKFRPGASSAGLNKYALAVEITEWRKPAPTAAIPRPTKRSVKVGTVVRDILMIVVDCQGNKSPKTTVTPPPPKVLGSFVGDSVVNVQTCNTSRIRINFTDPNATDLLDVQISNGLDSMITKYPFTSGSGSGSTKGLSGNGTSNPFFIFDITPEPKDAGRDYFITAQISDNSCPIKGVSSRTYTVHVVKNNLIEVQGNNTRDICFGDSSMIKVTHSRPDSVLGKKINYVYTWSIHPKTPNGDGLPANVNSEQITVSPTDTTRYLLTLTNGIGNCADTVSVVVNVSGLPRFDRSKDAAGKEKSFVALRVTEPIEPVNSDILLDDNTNALNELLRKYSHTGDSVRFGSRVVLMPNLLNTKKQMRSFNYSWSAQTERGKKYLMDSTSAIQTMFPFTTEKYFLKVSNRTGTCIDTANIVIKVSPFFLPNIITPNNDGKNDVFKIYSLPEGTSLQIFNRWGVMVKEFKDYKNDFGGEGVSDGTYYYYVRTPNNGPTYKGWFEVVRDKN